VTPLARARQHRDAAITHGMGSAVAEAFGAIASNGGGRAAVDERPAVTAIEPADSRNGKCWVVFVPCEGCRLAPAFFQRADGRRKPLGPHCATCHSKDHNACRQCGRCFAKWSPWESEGGRIDRSYCSNACRQRAYRQRVAHGVAR